MTFSGGLIDWGLLSMSNMSTCIARNYVIGIWGQGQLWLQCAVVWSSLAVHSGQPLIWSRPFLFSSFAGSFFSSKSTFFLVPVLKVPNDEHACQLHLAHMKNWCLICIKSWAHISASLLFLRSRRWRLLLRYSLILTFTSFGHLICRYQRDESELHVGWFCLPQLPLSYDRSSWW